MVVGLVSRQVGYVMVGWGICGRAMDACIVDKV